MKQLSKRMRLAMAVAAVMGVIFLFHTNEIYAESYTAPPQKITFGETYLGEMSWDSIYRYDMKLKKGGTVTVIGNMTRKYSTAIRIGIYSENGECLIRESVNQPYFKISVNLSKGNYYIKLDGAYDDTTFKLKPTYKQFPTTSVKSLSNKKGKNLKVTWAKKTSVSGYQIQIAVNSKFTKSRRTYTISDFKTTNKLISGLKKSKKYYVRIRTYTTTQDNVKAYSKWSSIKSVKITK